MTYDDFVALVAKEQAKEPGLRYGQLWYNLLSLHRSDLAHEINGTPLDPFHQEFVPATLHTLIQSRW